MLLGLLPVGLEDGFYRCETVYRPRTAVWYRPRPELGVENASRRVTELSRQFRCGVVTTFNRVQLTAYPFNDAKDVQEMYNAVMSLRSIKLDVMETSAAAELRDVMCRLPLVLKSDPLVRRDVLLGWALDVAMLLALRHKPLHPGELSAVLPLLTEAGYAINAHDGKPWDVMHADPIQWPEFIIGKVMAFMEIDEKFPPIVGEWLEAYFGE